MTDNQSQSLSQSLIPNWFLKFASTFMALTLTIFLGAIGWGATVSATLAAIEVKLERQTQLETKIDKLEDKLFTVQVQVTNHLQAKHNDNNNN